MPPTMPDVAPNRAESNPGSIAAPFFVRDQLESRFERHGRRRLRHWIIVSFVALVLLVVGFEAYVQVQFGTVAWWSTPPHISYCGWTYTQVSGRDPRPDALGSSVRVGSASVASRASLGRLVEVMSVPPLARPVFAAPDAFPGGIGKCADPIFYQGGSGELTEYAARTA
jgi:hypothetical protein